MLLFLMLSIVTEANELQASGRVPAVLMRPVTKLICQFSELPSALTQGPSLHPHTAEKRLASL